MKILQQQGLAFAITNWVRIVSSKILKVIAYLILDWYSRVNVGFYHINQDQLELNNNTLKWAGKKMNISRFS